MSQLQELKQAIADLHKPFCGYFDEDLAIEGPKKLEVECKCETCK